MSLVLPGTMLFAVFGAGAAGVAWVLFTPQSKRNDRRYGPRKPKLGRLLFWRRRRRRPGCGTRPRCPSLPMAVPLPLAARGERWGSGTLAKCRRAAPRRPHAAWGARLPHSTLGAREPAGACLVPLPDVVACRVCVLFSLVVQMAITATVCMWLMYVWPNRSGPVTIGHSIQRAASDSLARSCNRWLVVYMHQMNPIVRPERSIGGPAEE